VTALVRNGPNANVNGNEGVIPTMKIARIAGVLIGGMLLLAACTVKATKEPPPGVHANEPMAEALARALVDRDFDAARKDFNDRMQGALSREELKEVTDQYGGNQGAF
jgi:ABC-type amino acid transport substrate-binding protein